MTDPVADMITQIRNAGAVQKESVVLQYSKLKHAIAETLLKAGYVKAVEKSGKDTRKSLEISIAYVGTSPRIKGIQRVSKYSQRRYAGFKDLHVAETGRSMYVISTPEGVMSDTSAREKKVGGEVILKVW